jgi:hypothetical protein
MEDNSGLLGGIVVAEEIYVGGKRKRGEKSRRDNDGISPKGAAAATTSSPPANSVISPRKINNCLRSSIWSDKAATVRSVATTALNNARGCLSPGFSRRVAKYPTTTVRYHPAAIRTRLDHC